MKFKKLTAALSAFAVSAGMLSALPTANAADSSYNYAEALQKSMFFYEVQQAGTLPEWNYVQWRANSMVKEDGTPSDIVDGGWFDAGDHYKFTLTNAYSASVLAWGYLQYKDAVDKAGLGEVYRNNIQWGIDYVLGCDLGNGKMIGTIGDADDHVVWCSAEVYMRKHKLKFENEERPYDEITDSSTLALSAAALAQGYMIFKDDQPEKAAEYLKHAKSLFASADETRSNEDQGAQKQFYPTTSWVDDCMYAANWLYMATGDKKYLDLCEKDYIPNFPLENQSTDKKYTWGFCWDDTTQGAAMLYALNTGKKEWIEHISHHLDYWIEGYGGKKVNYTPDGLAYLMQWGPLRHAENTAWLAMLAADTIFQDDAALSKKYNDWAKSQMDYAFGDNELGLSYVLGMGDKNPTAIHHRTASGIHDDHWNELGQPSGGTEGWQTEYAHTLYGALIGGPKEDGSFGDVKVSDYQQSEVAIDYNAGYTAALCAMIDDYGGKILPDFPPTETPTWAEWEVSAVINGTEGKSYTEVKAWAMNHTAWPARVAKDIEYRYFFDVSEIIEAGLSVDDIKVEGKSQQYSEGDQGYATVSGPYKYEGDSTGNTYYAKIKFEDGRAIMPTGQSEHRDEVQFRISIPDAVDGKSTDGAWNAKNDWSYLGGLADATDLKNEDALNEHITMYVDGALVWGEEPDGTVPTKSDYVPTRSAQKGSNADDPTEPSEPDTGDIDADLYGDANDDGSVDMSDVVMVMQDCLNPKKYGVNGTSSDCITEKGEANADVDGKDGVTPNDALLIQKYTLKLISKFPCEE